MVASHRSAKGTTVAALLGVAVVTLAMACADTEDASPTPVKVTAVKMGATATSPAATAKAAGTVAVTAVDYQFQGLPADVPTGTTLTLVNRSAAELHELVAIRIPDTERRAVAQLVQLPESELDAIFGSGPPTTVILAPPGQPGMAVLGTGTLAEAGRYGILCFIPTGADPQEYMRAAQAGGDGPPQVAGGPPHVANGMFAELVVR